MFGTFFFIFHFIYGIYNPNPIWRSHHHFSKMVFYPPTSYHCGEICSLPYNGYNTSLYIYITPRTRTMVLYNIWLYIYIYIIYLSISIYIYIHIYIYIIYPLKFTGIFSTALPNGESVVWCKRWFRFAQIPMASDGSVTCRTGGSLFLLRSSPREDTISMTSKHENAYVYIYIYDHLPNIVDRSFVLVVDN